MKLYWPIAMIVLSNILYHTSARSMPDTIHPLASMTAVYVVSAAVSLILFFLLNRGGDLIQEYRHMNWTSYVMGLAIVGMEVGAIYMYKLGWNMNTGPLLANTTLAILLVFVGTLFFRESITPRKLLGVVVCLAGLYFVNT